VRGCLFQRPLEGGEQEENLGKAGYSEVEQVAARGARRGDRRASPREDVLNTIKSSRETGTTASRR